MVGSSRGSNGAVKVAESCYRIGDGVRLRPVHSLPTGFKLVLASFEPHKPRNLSAARFRKLAGGR